MKPISRLSPALERGAVGLGRSTLVSRVVVAMGNEIPGVLPLHVPAQL